MAKAGVNAIAAYCPGCDTQIRFKRHPHKGQLIACPECEDMLEVIHTSPIKLEWAYEDDDLWKDDDGDPKVRQNAFADASYDDMNYNF